jgi:hypothetical protein
MHLASAWSLAMATPMMEAYRKNLSVQFDNGDKLHVECKDACVLLLTVNGKNFRYTAKDLNNLELLANNGAYLYSGFGSSEYERHRERYFGFELSVNCPEEQTTGLFYRCYVGGIVQDGKLGSVEMYRTVETTLPTK